MHAGCLEPVANRTYCGNPELDLHLVTHPEPSENGSERIKPELPMRQDETSRHDNLFFIQTDRSRKLYRVRMIPDGNLCGHENFFPLTGPRF